MKKLISFLCLPLVAGCLTASSPVVADWLIDPPAPQATAPTASRGILRLSQVLVNAPYDTRQLVVLRADGSVAFDAYNRFATMPSLLLKGGVPAFLAATGRFAAVLEAPSAAKADEVAELVVSRLHLDCSTPGVRTARVSLALRFLDGARVLVRCVKGEGAADAAGGDYGAAFSKACAQALSEAVSQL